MNRSTLARRYAPLLAVAAIQLLIIAVVPSKAPDAIGDNLAVDAFDPRAGAAGAVPGAIDPATGEQFATDGGPTTGGTTAGGATGGAGGAGGGAGGGGGGAGGGGGGGGGGGSTAAVGDTSHCVGDRQYDPKIVFHAPPCFPKFTGKNAGATYQGVTDKTIKVVDYYADYGEAVNTILRAQGAFVEHDQQKAFNEAAVKFINDRYELYGRKIEVKLVRSSCRLIPPDEACLRNEARQIVKDEKPFFFKWNTSLASPFFDEFAKLKTPSIGGWHFRDEFSAARRPYHWDVQVTYSRMMRHFGEWYCKQLHGKPVQFAGNPRPPGQSLNGKERILGVIGTADPENSAAVNAHLKPELAKCGAKVHHEYYYSQNIETADQQRKAAVAKMRENPEATVVLCICDLVAPTFLYQTEQDENYYPENVLSGSGLMDLDKSGQSYYGRVACPLQQNCAFENAFGLAQWPVRGPINESVAARVMKAAGANVPLWETADIDWDYWNMIGTLLQAAGPNLNPFTMEAGAFRLPPRGGGNTGQILRRLGPNNYGWNQDMRIMYWDPDDRSPFNGQPGTYRDAEPVRFDLGAYQSKNVAVPQNRRVQ